MLKGGQDSLEGIAQWWMLEQKIRNETARVEEALERLVRDGLIMKLQGIDSRYRYRINPHMRKRIARLLKETQENA